MGGQEVFLILHSSNPPIFRSRTGVRVAEGTGLENRHTRKGIVGSNPTLSVRQIRSRNPAIPNCAAQLAQQNMVLSASVP